MTAKSDTNDRRTPRWFFEQCVARYGPFQIDVSAIADNALCAVWFGPGSPHAEDGLEANWIVTHRDAPTTCWANCPYGPPGTIERWIAKARHERDLFLTRTLFLLPGDISTAWYQDAKRTEIVEDVPFRLAFEAPDGSTKGNSALFGSVLVWIAPKLKRPRHARASRCAQTGDLLR